MPQDLLITQEHVWLRLAGEYFTLGITDFAQASLGEIIFVELPQLQKEFTQNEVLVVVESLKAVSDIYAPVNTKVIAVNEKLFSKPQLINQDPYIAGWLLKAHTKDVPQGLMTFDQYQKYLKS